MFLAGYSSCLFIPALFPYFLQDHPYINQFLQELLSLVNWATMNTVEPPISELTGGKSLVLCREVICISEVVCTCKYLLRVCLQSDRQAKSFYISHQWWVLQNTEKIIKVCKVPRGMNRTFAHPCHVCVLFLCIFTKCTQCFHTVHHHR